MKNTITFLFLLIFLTSCESEKGTDLQAEIITKDDNTSENGANSNYEAIKIDDHLKEQIILKNPEVQPLISIHGFLRSEDDVYLMSVYRLMTRSDFFGGQSTDIFAEMLDESGIAISSARIYQFPVEADSNSGSTPSSTTYMIQAYLPDTSEGSLLRLRKGEKVLWQRHAPETPITVNNVQAEVSKDSEGKFNRLNITWKINKAIGKNYEAWIRWSDNQGQDWKVLSVNEKREAASLDLSFIPGGKIVFEVMVHDGFYSATAISAPVFIPYKSPIAHIHYPEDGATIHD